MKRKKISWADPSKFLKELHVAEDVVSYPLVQNIIETAGLPVSTVPIGKTPFETDGECWQEMNSGKKHLFLTRNRGSFFKSCPGTSEYTCCGYYVLNVGMNCPMDCVYCILQAYLNQPWVTAFVNIDEMFTEIDAELDEKPEQFFRIGTGDFTDSLALENVTGLSKMLSEYIATKENAILELKTKSAAIENLHTAKHGGKTILSWSLNSQTIMQSQELRTATIKERLLAAGKAAELGYKLAFHFDPIILHDNWEKGYEEIVQLLFNHVDNKDIVWISLGALRYLPSLKNIGRQRFAGSSIFSEEFICGLDGKLRYFRTQREEMYKHLYTLLQSRVARHTCIYLCMESDEIWEEVFGYAPHVKGGLSKMLDHAALSAIKQ